MKKKLITFAIIIMVILANLSIVQAATTATATLKTNKDKVKPGDTFTVTLSVACEDGINGIDTTYSYDTDKLELVSANVKDSANWSSLGSDKQITVISNSTSKIKTADVYVLTFKLKDTVANGTTASISTTDILVDSDAATDSEKTVKALKVSVTAEAESSNNGNQSTGEGTGTEKPGDTTGEGTGTQQPSNTTTGTNNPTSNNTNSISKINTNTDNTVTKVTTLPKTGKSEIVLVIAGVLIIASVFAYKKYNNYKGL